MIWTRILALNKKLNFSPKKKDPYPSFQKLLVKSCTEFELQWGLAKLMITQIFTHMYTNILNAHNKYIQALVIFSLPGT